MMYAFVSTDRLETMLYIADNSKEAAQFMGTTISGFYSKLHRSRSKGVATEKFRIIPMREEDVLDSDDEDS